ncbi:lipid droplet-associated protein [Rhodococcus sp. NPDC058505]|uniref:lipid droplet-associated protein n=1 Tax=unclassified Rhodococcus (in: high G+C Gram-positive bacteria) TaxID=192944 RepID=UPI003654D4ED
MFRPPFAARVAAGIAVTLVEEVQKLPTTAVTLPMTAISSMLQTGMQVQQTVTALAIKGDEALAGLFPQSEEQPTWATFDEDAAPAAASDGAGRPAPSAPANQGRFELYSMSPAEPAPAPAADAAPGGAASAAADGDRAEIVDYLDYDNLTLAQLRARLRTLSVEELTALLDHENGTRSRAPFQTMLGNRITSATAK